MKNIKLIIITIFTLFIFSIDVNAGVCNKGNMEFCDYESNISFSSKGRMYSGKEYDPGYFMHKGYETTINGIVYNAFCLDPALSAPTNSYNKVREIDTKYAYDKELYRIYQQFINESNFLNSDSNNTYLEYALRLLTIKHGYHYINKSVSDEGLWLNNGSIFIGCGKKYIDSNIISDSYITTLGLNESYINNYSKENICFGNDVHEKIIKETFYGNSMKNLLWVNPLESKNSIEKVIIEPTESNPNYTYKFIMKVPGFFEFDTAIPSVNLNEAEIKGYISINDQACLESTPCNATVYNNISYIKRSYGNIQDQIEFTISFNEEQYNQYFLNGGTIKLNYSYNHPMNSENVFIAREDESKPSTQRMVVVKEFVHEDTSTIIVGNPIIESKECKHTTEGFFDDDGIKVNKLEDFLNSSCDCGNVNYNLLSDSDKIYYKTPESGCFESNESFSGEINSCNSSSSYENVLDGVTDINYEPISSDPLTYTKITTLNNYCTETCIETININNLKGKYATKAGMYFEFDTYPNLVANKKCTINIDYDKWNKDYETALTPLKNAYNAWQEVASINSSRKDCCIECENPDGSSCGCDVYYYTYNTNYEPIEIQNYTSLTTGGLQTYSIGDKTCGLKNWTSEQSNAWSNFLAELSKPDTISDLKTALKQCNQRLFTNDALNFYKFTQQLNYFYEQQYSNGNIILNSERTSKYGIDDSEFDYTQTGPLEIENSKSNDFGINKKYYTLNSNGIDYEEITTYLNAGGNSNEDIARQVEYKVVYDRPLIPKYSETMTSTIISSVTGSGLNNYSYLGYGYDTDVSSIAQKGNKSYYVFSKLGDSNNKLFNNFKDNNYGGIVRMCDYEITNDIMKTCENGLCDTKLNIIYRSVDPSNIDPNGRLDKNGDNDIGFSNWDNTNAYIVKKKIENDAKTKDTYSPENLEYSFTLDSATISAIRKSNKEDKLTNQSIYDRWDKYSFECIDGNKCKSKFISNANGVNGLTGSIGIKFGTSYKGRDTWKEIIDIGGNKYTIDGKEVNLNS